MADANSNNFLSTQTSNSEKLKVLIHNVDDKPLKITFRGVC